jgi:ABC-type antimicrobial peptide transport system permease subunit
MKPGVSLEQAQAEMSAIAAGIAERHPAVKKGWGATVDRYIDRIVGPDMRLSLNVLMWSVAAVLLIGCANLANLFMARATPRSREIALRMAVGASRGRVIRMPDGAQNPVVRLGLVAKGAGEGGALIKSVQQAVWKVNKDQVLERPQTVEQLRTDSMMSRRLTTSLLGGFALLAMFLACAGIYGVLSFVTARRTQEMGIRAAMGASRGDLIRMVIGGGSTPVLTGIVVGLAGAVGLSRFIESMLFATRPVDVLTLTGVSVLFLMVALAACLVPAWRAASVDPMSALRQD